LHYFLNVVDTGNISAAAAALNMAQPALGMQIKQLEHELGTALLVRHSRGVLPTPAGKLLYRHARRIVDAVEQAKHEVTHLKGDKPTRLRLGVNPSMVQVLGPNLLTEVKSILPDVKVSLTEERSQVLLTALERRQLDVAIAYNVEDRPDLSRQALIEEDLLFLTAPSKAKRRDAVNFSEVIKSELAIGGERSIVREIVEAEARRLSLSVRLAFEVHSLASMNSMVRRGVASTVMPYALCMRDIKKRTVTGRRIISPHLTRTLYVVHQRAHLPILDDERVNDYVLMLVKSYYASIIPFARWIAESRTLTAISNSPKAGYERSE
jgi:LysR family transcriptional regulator, nitrogen assimilation regulatory protein